MDGKLKEEFDRMWPEKECPECVTLRADLARKTAECTAFFEDGVKVRSSLALAEKIVKSVKDNYDAEWDMPEQLMELVRALDAKGG